MRLFIQFIFFIFFCILSQHDDRREENSARAISVDYKILLKDREFNKSFDSNTNDFLNESIKRKQSLLSNLIFNLKSNRRNYNFSYERPMQISENDEYELTAAISRAIDGNVIYTNILDSIAYLGGFDIGIKIDRKLHTYDVKWELKNETKTILGKKCYKAIGKLVEDDLAHSPSYPVTAWYSNELNFFGGPTPFATLPGLILELETNQAIIYAISIETGDFEVSEYKSKTKVMTYPEYTKYMKKWSKENRSIKN